MKSMDARIDDPVSMEKLVSSIFYKFKNLGYYIDVEKTSLVSLLYIGMRNRRVGKANQIEGFRIIIDELRKETSENRNFLKQGIGFFSLCNFIWLFEECKHDDLSLYDILDKVDIGGREREIMVWYYGKGKTFKQIGEIIGIAESRVCQIHKDILNKIRSKFNDRDEMCLTN